MKKLFLFVAAFAFVATGTVGAAETWKGTISDSMCGLKHSADKHEGKGADHRACVEKCVNGGGEYVFISNNKAIKIANQKFAGALEANKPPRDGVSQQHGVRLDSLRPANPAT